MSEFDFDMFKRRYENEGYLIGTLEEPLKPISLEGRELFTTKICVPRMSGNVDIIPVLFGEKIYSKAAAISTSEKVRVSGFYRSFDVQDEIPPIKHFFEAQNLQPVVKFFARNNSIHLCGNVCVAPWALGRGSSQLTYFSLSVRTPNDNNIFHCYVRPLYRDAVESLQTGDYVELYGRIQSIPSNKPDKPISYPVCVSKFDVIGYKGTHVKYRPKFTPIEYREQ